MAQIGGVFYSYDRALDLASYLTNETEYYPWHAACDVFCELLDKVDHETQLLLKKRIAFYMKNAISSTKFSGGSGNSHIERLKSTLLQEWACMLGNEECINYAKEEFSTFKSSQRLTDYDRRDLVFCYGLKHSTMLQKDYNFLLLLFKETNSIVLKMSILKSLGCISNQKFLRQCLKDLISDKVIAEEQYAEVIFESIIKNDQTEFNFTLKFFREQIINIQNEMKNSPVLVKVIYTLAKKLVTDYQIEQFKLLLRGVELPTTKDDDIELYKMLDKKKMWMSSTGTKLKNLLKNGGS